MNRHQRGWSVPGLGLLTVVCWGLGPTAAEAAWRGFSNDSGVAVYAQGAVVVNNVVRKGRPVLLQPGQSIWDVIQPGVTTIYIFDARRPTLMLFSGVLPAAANNQFFSIQMDAPMILPGGVQVPRAKLVPVVPTPAPPGAAQPKR
jgi:hypothetical protein